MNPLIYPSTMCKPWMTSYKFTFLEPCWEIKYIFQHMYLYTIPKSKLFALFCPLHIYLTFVCIFLLIEITSKLFQMAGAHGHIVNGCEVKYNQLILDHATYDGKPTYSQSPSRLFVRIKVPIHARINFGGR